MSRVCESGKKKERERGSVFESSSFEGEIAVEYQNGGKLVHVELVGKYLLAE